MSLHLLISHHQHVGHLLELGIADLGLHALGALVHLHPQTRCFQLGGHPAGMLHMAVGNGDEHHLNRRQPQGEGAGIVLYQHAQKALQGAQEGSVHHVGSMLAAVLSDEGEVETLGQIEVELHGGELPGATDGVAHVDVYLGAVEDSSPFVHLIAHPAGLDSLP